MSPVVPWCEQIELRVEAALAPGRAFRWGPLAPGQEDDSRADFARVWGPWYEAPDPSATLWVDISEPLMEVQWTGGTVDSDTVFPRWEAAQLRAVFYDPGLLFDPTNPLSPYRARLVPNTPIRIRGGAKIPPGIVTPGGTTGTGPGRLESVPGAIQAQADSDVRLTWIGAIASTGQLVSTLRMVNGGVQLRTDTARLPVALIALYNSVGAAVTGSVTGVTTIRYDSPMGLRAVWDAATTTLALWSLHDWPYGKWQLEGQISYPGHTVNPWPTGWQYHNAGTDGAYAANATHYSVEFFIDGVDQWSFGANQLRGQAPDASVIFTAQDTPLNIVRTAATPPITIDPESHPATAFTTLFGGFVDAWVPQWSANPVERRTEVTATDAVRVLAGFDANALPNPVGGGESAGARVNRILDYMGWPDAERDVSPGGVLFQATDHAQPAWTELLLTADTDGGFVWVAPSGFVTYLTGADIRARLSDPTPDVTFGCDGFDVLIGARPSFNTGSLRNVVTGSNGTQTVTARDTASIARYRAQTYRRLDLRMQASAEVDAWVARVLAMGAIPRRTISEVLIDPTRNADCWAWVLVPDALDIWRIQWDPPGTETEHTIQEDVTPRGWVHTVNPTEWVTVVSTNAVPVVNGGI